MAGTTKLAAPAARPQARLVEGRYAFQRQLGAGAEGRVWLALDVSQGNAPRAIKLVAPRDGERLRWEWEVLCRVQHPAIARVLDLLRVSESHPELDLPAGSVLMVSEQGQGEPLDRAVARLQPKVSARLPVVLRAAFSIARALNAFHRAGLVHGDVKPGNILLHGELATLIDPGLAAPPSLHDAISGTPAFLAPEAWRGERTFAADCYALGITLITVLSAPSDAVVTDSESSTSSLDPVRFLRDALRATERVRALPTEVPAAFSTLLAELVATEPSARPTAAETAARIAAIARGQQVRLPLLDDGAVGGGADEVASDAESAARVLSLPSIGQESARAELVSQLQTPAVIRVVGAEGSGRSRLVRDAVFALQAQRLADGRNAPSYLCVDTLPQHLLAHDCVVHVTSARATDAPEAARLVTGARLDGHNVSFVLELDVELDVEPSGNTAQPSDVLVRPLARKDMAQLLREALPQTRIDERWVDEAMAVSGGLAGRLCRVLSQLRMEGDGAIKPARLRSIASASTSGIAVTGHARTLCGLLACAGGSLDVETARVAFESAEDVSAAAHSLTERGLAAVDGSGCLTLRPDIRKQASTLLPATSKQELCQKMLAHCTDPVRRAYLFDACGDSGSAADAWRDAIAALRARGELDVAARVGRDALARLSPDVASDIAVALARVLTLLGHYAEVSRVLLGASSVDARLCVAEAERRSGHIDAARMQLDAAMPTAGDRTADIHAGLARVELDAGNHQAARSHVDQCASGSRWARARGCEVAALLAMHDGESNTARDAANAGLKVARELGEPSEVARALSVLATIALSTGDVTGAAEHYASALELADRAGDRHGAALCLLNLGLARVDRGELGPGLSALRDAARRLLAVGRQADAARALYNVGNAASLVGDDDMALSALTLAQEAAAVANVPAVQAYALICEAEIAQRRTDPQRAATLLDDVSRVAGLSNDERNVVAARSAAVWCLLGHVERARDAVDQVAPSDTPLVMSELAIAHARLALASGRVDHALTHAEHALAAAERAGTFELRLRAWLLVGEAYSAADRASDATRCYESARTALDRVAQGLSPSERARLRQVSTYRLAFRAAPTARVSAGDPSNTDRWRKLATLSAQLVGEERPSRLLERVLDAAIVLANAERGFVVVQGEQGLQVRASRGLTNEYLSDASAPSRTFVARVIRDGRPMASVDALQDARLDGAISVHALALRSVIAVPLRADDHVTGAIYLDDRLRPFAFGEEEIALLVSLADVAALALNGARRLHAERLATKQLKRMRKRLRRTVETQAIELSSLRSTSDGAVDHPSIIGRGPAMRSLLAMVDRVARSELPVLIAGESGTGKELVARTIHDHGPRQGAAFVSENCSAIPETLLESALFGHVRGAFTGADRARVGLFDAADGGTLFLDEVGEMSPAMQTRLLRVLQDGEIRSVGAERTRKVDVRVIAATHRDLEQMVRDGTFREDLYYRLAVVNLKMPALRDRAEDIPELVAHFVRKHAVAGQPARVDRKTLALLSKHAWPGNVRQLENEIRRALVVADGVVRPEHLSATFSGDTHVPLSDLDLRGQTDALERRLIRTALDQTHHNQTQAAKLLGVSRYGLQKMLKRLELS